MGHKWEFQTNHHATEPGFVPAPLLPERPHRPTGEPPRCRACDAPLPHLHALCTRCFPVARRDGDAAESLIGRIGWKSIIDYAYGKPAKVVTR
jgi:hypothetical protein